jgi:signal peptide peptidase SppA
MIVRAVLNRPLALLPTDASLLLDPSAQLVPPDARQSGERPYTVVAGVAVVPIRGALTHGAAWWWSDCSTYDGIRRNIAGAVADAEVRAIALHVNSPGGDAQGCFDLADAIYAVRGEKPIWAILDENAFSAAYALACAADVITVPRTGGTGSIGCIMLHADITRMLEEAGIKVTTIQYGAQKSDGYPTTPMNGAALARAQAMIDGMGEMFVAMVARNRKMSAKAVRATEAGIFIGADGVAAGLADKVLSPDEAFLALVDSLG